MDIKTIILTNKTWHRGEGSDASYVRIEGQTSTTPLCCLGNLVRQERLGNRKTSQREIVDELPQIPLPVLTDIYAANDDESDEYCSEQERVDQLNKLIKPYGYQFEYREN